MHWFWQIYIFQLAVCLQIFCVLFGEYNIYLIVWIKFMDIQKEGSMNNLDAMDGTQNVNQNMERAVSGSQLPRNTTNNSIQPQQQFLQVTQRTQMPFGTQADFQRVLNDMLAKKQLQPIYEPSFRRMTSIKKQQKYISPQQQQKERLLAIVEPQVKKYKTLNTPNSSDSEVSKLRAQIRQKIFRSLLYGIQQLKTKNPEQLNQQQLRISKLTAKDPYHLVKTLTTQIDIQFLKKVNNDNKQVSTRKYRTFLKNFALHVAEYTNYKLRRRILTRELTAKKMATMEQEQFYPDHVRKRILEKHDLFLKDLQAKPAPQVFEQEPQIHYSLSKPTDYYQQKKQQKPKYKHLEPSTYSMLKDFLHPEQIQRMRNTLLSDLRKDIEAKLLANFDKVFSTSV